jgi:hypothetical protein
MWLHNVNAGRGLMAELVCRAIGDLVHAAR